MKANTRLFGEIDIDEEKIITLENGMIGFPDLRKFTLIFDKEKRENTVLDHVVSVHGRTGNCISGHASK